MLEKDADLRRIADFLEPATGRGPAPDPLRFRRLRGPRFLHVGRAGRRPARGRLRHRGRFAALAAAAEFLAYAPRRRTPVRPSSGPSSSTRTCSTSTPSIRTGTPPRRRPPPPPLRPERGRRRRRSGPLSSSASGNWPDVQRPRRCPALACTIGPRRFMTGAISPPPSPWPSAAARSSRSRWERPTARPCSPASRPGNSSPGRDPSSRPESRSRSSSVTAI